MSYISRNYSSRVLLVLATLTLLYVAGCSHNDSPSRATLKQIDEVANRLEPYGIRSSYSGVSKMLDAYSVSVGIGGEVKEIPISIIHEFPIPVHISFSGRNVSVADIRELAKLPNVTFVRFNKSHLSSDVLAELSSLHGVQTLAIMGGECEIDAQRGWSLPPNTRQLELEAVDNADELLASCTHSSASKLESFSITGASISPNGMELVASSGEITELFLTDSQADDSIAAQIASLVKLRRLELNQTGFTDEGIKSLRSLDQIEMLGLSGTDVTNGSFGVLTGLPALRVLDITNTKVDPEGIRRVRPKVILR